MLPQSGAEYSYLRIGFGDLIGFLVAWLYILLLNPSGNAVMGMTCATYLLTPLFDDGCGEPPDDLIRMVGVAVLCKILIQDKLYCAYIFLSQTGTISPAFDSSPLGTRRCYDVATTSMTLIQRRNNAVCPVNHLTAKLFNLNFHSLEVVSH